MELVPEEYHDSKPTITFQSIISTIHQECVHQDGTSSSPPSIVSTITIVTHMTKNISIESNRSSALSVLRLSITIEDDDGELFSTSRRNILTIQMEQVTMNDFPLGTSAFVISKPVTNSNLGVHPEVSFISQNDQPLTQASTPVSGPTPTSNNSF